MDVLDEHPSPSVPPIFLVVAGDHPSLIEARDRFAAMLRAEQRFFGRACPDPKPFPSLIAKLLADDGLRVACGTGVLALRELQRAGKRPVSARDFANAVNLAGLRFGA